MKRILGISLVLVLFLSLLVGCQPAGGDSSSKAQENSAPYTESEGPNGELSTPGGEDSSGTESGTGSDESGANPSTTTSRRPGSKTITIEGVNLSGRVSDLKGRKIIHNIPEHTDESSESYKIMRANHDAIEKKYNCKIEYLKMGSEDAGKTQFLNSVLAGKPLADTWMQGHSTFLPRYKAGLLQNLSKMNVFDFESDQNPWPVYMEAAKLDGAYYGVMGTDTASMCWNSPVLLYNKKLLQDYVPQYANSLYSLQQSGDWTWDKFAEVCEAFNKAASSEPSLTACFDASGLTYQLLLATSGTDWLKYDSKGNVVFNGNDSKAQAALNQFKSYVEKGIVRLDRPLAGIGAQWVGNMVGWEDKYQFLSGQALFGFNDIGGYYWNVFQHSGTLQTVKDNVGVLLVPKMKKSDNYTYSLPLTMTGYSIPYGVKKPNEVATILNAMYTEKHVSISKEEARNNWFTESIEPTLNSKTGEQTKNTILKVYDEFGKNNITVFISPYATQTTPDIWSNGDSGWIAKYVFDIAHGNMAQSAALSAVTSKYNKILATLTEKR